jgi:hypothetical protein
MVMTTPIWDELRRTADEVEVQIHLAGMEARDRWRALQPRLVDLGKAIAREGDRVSDAVARQLADVDAAVRRLRDDIVKQPKH